MVFAADAATLKVAWEAVCVRRRVLSAADMPMQNAAAAVLTGSVTAAAQ